jgi:putative endonuclease
MSEWSIEHAWKACVRETVPRVRIPFSPPAFAPPETRAELRLGQRFALAVNNASRPRMRRRTSIFANLRSLPNRRNCRHQFGLVAHCEPLRRIVRGSSYATDACMGQKTIVYILRSERDPSRHYTGLTSDLDQRLYWHNAGQNTDTANDRPWTIVVSFHFNDEAVARRFERYLKSGSGREFSKRHFSAPVPGT